MSLRGGGDVRLWIGGSVESQGENTRTLKVRSPSGSPMPVGDAGTEEKDLEKVFGRRIVYARSTLLVPSPDVLTPLGRGLLGRGLERPLLPARGE